jgi:FAD/FMN-containing dehydrogenase
LGRSYGDASLNAGGRVLDMTAHRGVRDFAVTSGRITVDAGLSLHDLMRAVLPFGWFVPVTPGTRFVTVGGCIACDMHGKNHHRDGGFADNVVSFMLLTPARGGVLVTARDEPTLFWATAGGMGLTGIITEVTIQLIPVETAHVRVDTERVGDLDDLMERMASGDHRYRYSVAWIDLLARGRSMGRSVLTAAEDDPERAVTVACINYVGAVSAGLHVARHIRRQGHGTLVVLSSVAGERVRRSNFVYGSTKAGLDAFSQGLDAALVGSGGRVMIVRPGFVTNAMTAHLPTAPLATTSDAVAAAVVRGLERRTAVVWVPGILRVVMSVLRHLPRAVFRHLPM